MFAIGPTPRGSTRQGMSKIGRFQWQGTSGTTSMSTIPIRNALRCGIKVSQFVTWINVDTSRQFVAIGWSHIVVSGKLGFGYHKSSCLVGFVLWRFGYG